MEVVQGKWRLQIYTNSEKSRKRKRLMKETFVPDPEDVKVFGEKLRELNLLYINNLIREITIENYENLSKVLIALVLVFNAIRPIEASKIEIDFFLNRVKYQTEDINLFKFFR